MLVDDSFFITYPDGQQDISVLGLQSLLKALWSNREQTHNTPTFHYTIRIQRFQDVERLLIINSIVKNFKRVYPAARGINITIPYLFGARGDRDFGKYLFYFRDVVAPILNSLYCDAILVARIHSAVAENLVPNIEEISDGSFLDHAASRIHSEVGAFIPIIPDAGAAKAFEKFFTAAELTPVQALKMRNILDGSLSKAEAFPREPLAGKHVAIFDDICSRGGTFMNLSKVLYEEHSVASVRLVVTHYEGSADTTQLKKAGIVRVYTTNSILPKTEDGDFVNYFNMFE